MANVYEYNHWGRMKQAEARRERFRWSPAGRLEAARGQVEVAFEQTVARVQAMIATCEEIGAHIPEANQAELIATARAEYRERCRSISETFGLSLEAIGAEGRSE